MTDLFQSLKQLIPLFDQLNIPYAVMGGIAVRAYGIPRPTYDLDFTVALPRERLHELYDAVQSIAIRFRRSSRRAGSIMSRDCRWLSFAGIARDWESISMCSWPKRLSSRKFSSGDAASNSTA